MYYINMFFIFSFFGHFIENIVYTKVDSGILYGIWTPIYGFGTILILLIYKYTNKLSINKMFKTILLFTTSSIVLAILETIGGYYIEITYGRVFWNYNNHILPIGKYTSLKMMLIWGLSSIVFIYLLLPIVNKVINYIPKKITLTLISLFIIDNIYTYSKIAKLFLIYSI